MADINEYSKHFLDQTGLSQVWEKVKAEDAKKVDKEISTSAGKALVFNESDGCGIKFEGPEHWSAVATNNSDPFPETEKGIGAQLYDWKMNGTSYEKGSVIDVTEKGVYYYNGNYAGYATRDTDANEIAVKGDISEYSMVKDSESGEYASVYHLTKDGVNVGAAIEIAKDQVLKSVEIKVCTEKDKPISGLNVGDKYIDFEWSTGTHSYIAVKDFVQTYTADEQTLTLSSDNVFSVKAVPQDKVTGLVDALASKALQSDLTAEISRATVAEATLQTNIDNEASTRAAADALKVDKEVTSSDGKALIFNEADGGGAKFEHTDGTWSFAGVNNGGANGMAGQIYAVDSNDGYKGAKLDVWKKGIFYTTGDESLKSQADRASTANEIATVGKISAEATRAQAAESALSSGKVDKPVEPVSGQGVNVPYYFDVTYEATKAVVKDYTVDLLDNTKSPQVFSLDINAASATTAGLMTASHYEKMEGLIPLTSAEIEAICQ